MDDLLVSLHERIETLRAGASVRGHRQSRHYTCRCGGYVYFDNPVCLRCKATLGYLPDEARLAAVEPTAQPGNWITAGREQALKFCANHHSPAACNWMLNADSHAHFCISCRLNRTIPNLDDADNVRYWNKIEAAKRRLVSQLLTFGSPVRSKIHDDPQNGLMFDFLRQQPGGPPVRTGHASGLITINVEEADDSKREKIRHAMNEPYRTLLGHFRHEIGHYYWDRLVWNTRWLEPFRQLFGDERASYADALRRNYEQGPPEDWANSYISAYSTMHPWEDWAETWAHFMHITDSLVTAMGFGLDSNDLEGDIGLFDKDTLYAPEDTFAGIFLEMLNSWREITVVLNQIARSMGNPDFYPFVISQPAVAKLQFVQMVISDARTQPEL